MKPARLAVLGIAVVAAGVAVMLMPSSKPQQPTIIVEKREAEPVPTARVLVARTDLEVGRTITDKDLDWQPWPAGKMSAQAIEEGKNPEAYKDVLGSIVRSNFFEGEPIRQDKLIKANGSGFMSAILPSGKRALAITIDNRGSSTAGGFILPNDRVDVINTFRDAEASKTLGIEVMNSETLLTNVRILAIGQKIQEMDGNKTVVGETATLELDPKQAELVVLAQRTGMLSLALRSLADTNKNDTTAGNDKDGGTTVIRYGVPTQSGKK